MWYTEIREKTNDNLTVYLYDESGLPIGMQYHGANYAANTRDVYWYERVVSVIAAVTAVVATVSAVSSFTFGSNKMEYYRYGKLKLSDYCISWVCIAVLLFFSIGSIILNLSFLFVAFPLIYAAVWLWAILAPHRERFIMDESSITVLLGKKTRTIALPSELTLVVSYADVCPPLAFRTATEKQTHILKDKYAVSILHKMPLDIATEALHRNQIHNYTTSTVQRAFDESLYIYGFVCNQSQIDRLIANRNCLLIIPESLQEKISVDRSVVDVHIDYGS